MKKVFVFCIGGTGERVMKSITMLMAAGMSTHGYTVVPIIIDPHLDLDEKKNLQTLMLKYGEIQKSMLLDGKCPEGFFNSEMKLIDELDTVTNDTNKVAGEDRSYADFLDMGNLDVSSIPRTILIVVCLWASVEILMWVLLSCKKCWKELLGLISCKLRLARMIEFLLLALSLEVLVPLVILCLKEKYVLAKKMKSYRKC